VEGSAGPEKETVCTQDTGQMGEGEMMGDWFVYGLITLNTGAMVFYAWDGLYTKAFYWACVIGLNLCVLKGMK
jgi:hypothetical protein